MSSASSDVQAEPADGQGSAAKEEAPPTVAWMKFEANDKYLGKVYFKLRPDIVPKTCENFFKLCAGSNELGLSYKGTRIFKIMPGFIMQMGDVTNNDGSGGRSVFDSVDGMFEDENFFLQHTQPGIIACANWGRPNTNNSQFYVCLADDAPWLDGKSVVFGHVSKGMHVIRRIESMGSMSGAVHHNIVITDCGIVDPGA